MTATRPVRPAGLGQYEPHETYQGDERARAFWRLSFRSGRDYIRGKDAHGQPLLIEHEREEATSYARRLRTTKPRAFVGPILRRYNRLVFRKAPVRDAKAVEPFARIVADADGSGRSADAIMADALLFAQVERECYLLPDVSAPVATGAPATVAAVRAAGSRPIIRTVRASAVLNWSDEGGSLREVAMLWDRADGVAVLRVYDSATLQDFPIDPAQAASGSIVVVGIDEARPHGYRSLPVVRLRPDLDPLGPFESSCGDSQAGPLAESQSAIVNLLSLLREEISNVTFSQMIASGVSDSQVKDVAVGNNRVLCLPNPAASVKMIGADPAQASSIRDAIEDEAANLLRTAGVNAGDGQQAQSGVALAFRHNDLATIAGALAGACEQAEAQLIGLIAGAWAVPAPDRTIYQGKDAELPDFDAEARAMVVIVGNSVLPAVIRRKVAERFASRNLAMDEADADALRASIEESSEAADDNANAFPFPRSASRRPRPVEAG